MKHLGLSNMKAISHPFSLKHNGDMGLRHGENCRVTKGSAKPNEGDIMTPEMQECFQKLINLVPTIPRTHKISKVQLLQHVIDYILDLEVALDYPNFVQSPPPQLINTASALFNRTPLSEKVDPNPIVSHEDFVEMITDTVVERPVSK
ncbi:DNA-binding protein inhibitor ID-2 [Octopus bimaculoides]|uniref:DNA-binding protein inhibitor ID-2 n=1 Tax=Octopus bimaculoides TaxID=37653 RepID=UPI00071E32FE|nr:DNA-binding protein inhibitor ID-2 [Octopus bimaculoides]|eukprot:XP_014782943.1 PREDICTED: DNA-binding protein inhibitor ID-2-like [Octopus bimaculoides]